MFHSARLKLTAWYVGIIMLISISFSVGIYKVLTSEIDRVVSVQRSRIERRLRLNQLLPPGVRVQDVRPPTLEADLDILEDAKRRIILRLIIIDSSILFASAGLAYLLAGRTLAPIQEMLDEQNRFISDSSHELRTPLTSLKSALEVNLRDKNLTLGDAKALLSESIIEVNRLQSLSDDLLKLAQYQKPNGHNQFERIVLPEVIKKALRTVEPLAQKKYIQIDDKITKVEMNADPFGLHDLFVILLDNAIKYSPEHSKVTISSHEKDGFVQIMVSDEGIGIHEKDIPHIFDRFYQADKSRTKTDVGGYGLGLSIAKNIVQIHNGTILVNSIKNKGTTFTVRLPIKDHK